MVENKYVDDSMNKESGNDTMGNEREIPQDEMFDGADPAVETEAAGAPDDGAVREGDGRDALAAELKKRDEEIASLKDVMQRRQADFENFKKRNLKQQEEQRKMAVRDIALDIIAINDDLLRAIEAAEAIPQGENLEASHAAFVEGVHMISRRIEDALTSHGVVAIDTLNAEFDPCVSEAVEIVASDEVETDTVTKVYQKGFMLDDMVIRHAKVRVSRSAKQGAKDVATECATDGSG